MRKILCVAAALAICVGCEQRIENPPDKVEKETTIVPSTEKKEVNTTIVNPPATKETTTTTPANP